ncbi:LIM domain-binding protein 2-like isoform X2 [Oculina patagonica]
MKMVKAVSLTFLRLENTQYDASNGVGDDGDFGNSPMSGSPSLWSADRKPNQDDSIGD